MNTIQFSSNPQWKGKTVKTERNGKVFQMHGDKIVSLGKRWVNMEMTPAEMFDAVAVEGFSIGPALLHDDDGTRSERTFASHQVAFVDIDQGFTIEQMVMNTVYQKYAAGFYTTPSHKPEHHKFRIIFLLDTPIVKVDDMRKLYTGLINLFGGDEACKDGSRLFFGTVDADLRDFDESKVLPDNLVRTIINEITETELTEMESQSQIDYTPPSDSAKAAMLSLLKRCYCGNYDIWFSLAAAMKDSGYTLQDFIEVSVGHLMKQKTKADCNNVWKGISGTSPKPAHFGTLVWFVRSKLGNDAWKTTTDKRADIIGLATGRKS